MPPNLSPLWISLKVSLLATGLTFFAGIAVAYWMLNYHGRGKSLLEGIFVSPLILPPTVVGFILLILLGRNGAIGHLLQPFDFSLVFTWYGAVITATVVSFPLMYRTALGAFEQIDASLLDVARTLGASEWTVFRRILLPLAIPGILAGTTLAFARALGEFGATLMLAGNIPGQTQTIPMAIYFDVEAGDLDQAWFWAITILCLSLSGIVAVNLWQAQQKRKRLGRSPSQLKPNGSNRKPQTANPKTPTSFSPLGLAVDLQKQLASFQLQIDFRVAESTLGILGGSGAGKSMLLRCLAGMETPTQGRIVLNGRVLFDAERQINIPSRDRRIGFLVQNYALFPHLTVADNIAFGLPQGLSKAETQQQVDLQLVTVQLEGYGDRYPHQLSGGQQQRVALARALASQPEALLLDEPFSALDTYLRSQMEQEMILQLSHYNGVSLFVTHNLEEVYRVCPNLLVLHEGQAIAAGPKQEIFERPATYTVAKLTGCKNFSQAVALAPNQIYATDWGITLQVIAPLPNRLAASHTHAQPPDPTLHRELMHIGIRAHQITFTDQPDSTNTFPCWLAMTSETPHRITLFLKFHAAPTDAQDYHIQAEVFKEKWATIKDRSFPLHVQLDPLRLILMT
jgi:molybdate ABC transporter permease protein